MSTLSEPEHEEIEHLIQQPVRRIHQTPLLFMHGSWHGAWCWEPFLGYFCSQGYEVHALSLPGHGASSLCRGHIDKYSFGDYVMCLARSIEKLDPTPVVIGHSLGGAILQCYLEDHNLPGAVLLASIPAMGFMRGFLRMARAYPWQAIRSGRDGYALVERPDMAARFFLSHPTQIDIGRFHSQLVRESAPASQRTLKPILRHPENVKTPVLVIAGGKDFVASVDEERQTAEALHAQFVVFPDSPHDLMLESGWQEVAATIDTWITRQLREQ